MKRFLAYVILVFILFFPSCGKKGPIYPPVEKIPKNVEGFKIIQQGDEVALLWLNPSAYIDGSPMPNLAGIEIWNFEEEKESEEEFAPLMEESFIEGAEILVHIPREKFPEHQVDRKGSPLSMRFSYRFKLSDIGTRRLSFAMKVKDDRGRFTDFSELRSIVPQVAALPPENLSAAVHKDSIELNWDPPSKNIDQSQPLVLFGYNVYRSSGEGEAARVNSLLLSENRYEDKNFVFGNLYRYHIRSSSTEASPFLESQESKPIEILAKDTFPPEPPGGLVAIAGESSIALSWDPSGESDLAGYKVLRRLEGAGKFVELTPEGVQENSYSDASVEKGKRYEYAVVALDRFGNISSKSKSVLAITRGGMDENIPLQSSK